MANGVAIAPQFHRFSLGLISILLALLLPCVFAQTETCSISSQPQNPDADRSVSLISGFDYFIYFQAISIFVCSANKEHKKLLRIVLTIICHSVVALYIQKSDIYKRADMFTRSLHFRT